MKLLCFLALGAFTLTACAQEEQQGGFMHRALQGSVAVVKKPFARFGQTKAPLTGQLQMQLRLDPEQVKLSETRQIQATLSLTNISKKLVQLEFPTTQRVEVTVRNPQGKTVVQWSEDESFTNDPGFVAINPGEHVEYNAALPTRDLVPGQLYTIEGFFPRYPQLHTQKLVTPTK